ncbi:MAG TPA: hypothetical protein VK110_01830 [Salinisphaeraceae bacterium]|nr:hypothetical protein [Salinisphaeraceae bacterium]
MSEWQPLVNALLQRHGRTFAAELGIELRRNTPAPLFRLLCLAMLSGAPVQADIAMQAAKALGEAGWTTPQKLRDSTWQARAQALNAAGYARIDEKTATQIAALNDTLLAQYDGDLRQLRAQADGDLDKAHKALQGFKGIGKVGASIFLREVQAAWGEFHPYADQAALKAAQRLGLPDNAEALAGLVARRQFPRLIAALVRTQLARDFDVVRQAAG